MEKFGHGKSFIGQRKGGLDRSVGSERILKIDRVRDCGAAGRMARRDEGEYPSSIFD
jgi:hypothetical protein